MRLKDGAVATIALTEREEDEEAVAPEETTADLSPEDLKEEPAEGNNFVDESDYVVSTNTNTAAESSSVSTANKPKTTSNVKGLDDADDTDDNTPPDVIRDEINADADLDNSDDVLDDFESPDNSNKNDDDI
jgi:hypothetical protein